MDSMEYKEAAARNLGQAVRGRRKSLSLTQQQLADHAGVGVAFLYDLEQGKSGVRLDKVLDVLRTLGLELSVMDGKRGIVASTDQDGSQ